MGRGWGGGQGGIAVHGSDYRFSSVNTGNLVGNGDWSPRFCKPRWSTAKYNDSVSIERYL